MACSVYLLIHTKTILTLVNQDQCLYQAYSYSNLRWIPDHLLFTHFFSNNLFSLRPLPSQHGAILMTEALHIKFIVSDWFVRGQANALMASLMNIQRPCLATECNSWLWHPFTADVEMTKPSFSTDCYAWPHYPVLPMLSQYYCIAPASY